jgi:hypothetical protein
VLEVARLTFEVRWNISVALIPSDYGVITVITVTVQLIATQLKSASIELNTLPVMPEERDYRIKCTVTVMPVTVMQP